MRRFVTFLLVFSLLFSLTGCGAAPSLSAGAPPSPPPSDNPTPSQPPSAQPSEIPPSQPPSAQPSELPPSQPIQAEPSPSAPAEEDMGPNDAYFDNALFVGDSIMEGIRQYVASRRKEGAMLGEAKFLATTIGISLADLVGDKETPNRYSYKGEEKPLEDIAVATGATRIFLLLGLNDLEEADIPVETALERYSRLMDRLGAAVPDAEIIVLINPPKVASTWLPSYTANRKFGNALIDEFAAGLIVLCENRGVPYVDIHTALENEQGVLADEHCRDGFVHLNHAGAAVVVDALYEFAQGKT